MVATYVLAAWTLFIWGTRIRNAAQDDESALAFVLPAVLIVLAVLAVVKPRRWTRLFALVSIAVWLVRVPMIATADHDAAFIAVHAGLGVITWLLAWWALRQEGRRPTPA